MSRNSSGTYSLPNTVNPVVSLTPIATIWGTTTLNDIANELTNSLDRSGRGAMAAPLAVPSGSAAAPSLTFNGELNTGFYKAAPVTLGFTTGGVQRATLDATKLAISAALQAGNGSVGSPAISFSSETASGLYRAGAGDIRLAVGGVDQVQVTSSLLTISSALTATGLITGAGVTSTAGITATQSTTNGAGAVLTGNGTGNGATITGGSGGGTGLAVTAGGTNGAGMTVQGKGTGIAMAIDASAGGATGLALQLTGNSTKAPLKIVSLAGDPSSGTLGDIYVNADGTLRIYNGSAWVKVGTQT